MDPLGIINKIYDVLVAPDLQRALLPVKIVFIAISLVFLILIILFLKLSTYKNYLFLDFLEDWRFYKKMKKGQLAKFQAKEEPEPSRETEQEVGPAAVAEAAKKAPAEKLPRAEEEEDFNKLMERKKQELGEVKTNDWQRIIDKIKTRDELKCKLAVIDANRLLEKVLKDKNRKIESLSNFQDLKKIEDYLERLLDSPQKGITLRNTHKIIAVYKKALEELGVI